MGLFIRAFLSQTKYLTGLNNSEKVFLLYIYENSTDGPCIPHPPVESLCGVGPIRAPHRSSHSFIP